MLGLQPFMIVFHANPQIIIIKKAEDTDLLAYPQLFYVFTRLVLLRQTLPTLREMARRRPAHANPLVS